MKISKKKLLEEIHSKDANLSEIAKSHSMTYAGVLKRIKEDPDLTNAMQEARESLLDTAQSQLGMAVRGGQAWAVKFVLETWGKERGFTKQTKVESKEEPMGPVLIYMPDDGRETGVMT